MDGCGDYVLCFIHDVVIGDCGIAGLGGVIEKLRFNPPGAHGHDPDAPGLQLLIQGAAVAEDESLGGAVYIEVWHRLERGQGVQFDDFAVPVHIRKGQLGHGYQGFAIEVNHIHAVLQRNLVVPSKFPEAGAVDQNLDFWLHHIQQICIPLKAVRVQQIHGNGTDGAADLILQRFQRLLPAGDDPHFVEVCLMGKLDGKLPAHAGAGAGNDRNFHIHSSCDMGS